MLKEMEKDFSQVFRKENLESKKQAGCMSGIFQLFDCQLLMGGRQFRGYRRNSSGHVPVSPRSYGSDFSKSRNLEKNLGRRYPENPRSSMDSSRTSFSSSFTSFSSLEHKSPEEEPKCMHHHSVFSGKSPKDSPRTQSVYINQSPPAIKETAHKDFQKVSIEGEGHKRNKFMKHIDAPRTIDLLKLKELDESLRILIKLEESSRKLYEGESPQLSCEGRDILQSFKNSKQTANMREEPRLSLDSKESLLRCNQRSAASNQLRHLETKENNPSIVTKLMGLEPINSAAHSSINAQNNKTAVSENKREKPSVSPRNLKTIRVGKKPSESSSVISDGETPKMKLGYVETNVKKKIGSAYSEMEKEMQNLQFQQSNKSVQDFKRAILESRKNCNWKLSSVNALSQKSNKDSISERTLRSPIVVMESESKSAISFSPVTKHEGPPTLGKIWTSNSNNRRKDMHDFQTDGEQATRENKANSSSPRPLSKEPGERADNNTKSPRLQQMKHDPKKKYYPFAHDSKKSQRQTVNSQSSDSVSPRGKTRNPRKAKDDELQNSGNKVNMEALRTTSSTEGKSDSIQQNIRSPSVKELEMVTSQQSSPNSVLDASLKQDDLPHSPVSSTNAFKAEQQNLPSDHSLNTAHQSPTRSSALRSRNDYQKPESMDTIIQGSRVLRTNELSITNATLFPLGSHNQENHFEAETILASGLLLKELDLLSTLQQTNSDKPSKSDEKINTQMLHQKLFFDVVNEILARRMEVFSSGHDHMLESNFLRFMRLNKRLYKEIKCLRNSKGMDDNSILHNDLLHQSQAWDTYEGEVPEVVLEIERLIFKDLINEVVGGEIAAVLKAKRRRHPRMYFDKSGI